MWEDILKSNIKNKGRILRGISRVITTYEFDVDSEHMGKKRLRIKSKI